jgi:hypothetical protein
MAFLDEMVSLASEFTTQLGAATSIKITRNAPGTFTPATQVRAATGTEFTITNFVRSASRRAPVSSGGSGGFVMVEEFSYSVTRADLVTAGWNGTDPLDENCQITDGNDVFQVVSLERECGEKLMRFVVRKDSGAAL